MDDPKALQPLMLQLGVDAAHPLSKQLTAEQVAKLNTVATEAGVPGGEAGMDPLRPWLAALMLSVAPMTKAGFDPQSGVELILKPEFVAAGKPVRGFETAEQQFHFFSDLPEKVQVDYLNSTVDEFDTATERFKKLVAAWYAGDTKGLDALMSKDFRDKYPDLYQDPDRETKRELYAADRWVAEGRWDDLRGGRRGSPGGERWRCGDAGKEGLQG